MVKILIVVEGGVIQSVHATEPVEVHLRDFDTDGGDEYDIELPDGSVCCSVELNGEKWENIVYLDGLGDSP